jgi:hypothetical protein
MPRYLVTCECGQPVPVEIGQAGGHVRCPCGRSVEVPTLRRLRHLPIEQASAGAQKRKWSTRRGIAAALFILAAALAVVGVGLRLAEPTAPPLNIKGSYEKTLERSESLTPADWFEVWTYHYRPSLEAGFEIYENQLSPPVAMQVAKKRLVQKGLLGLGAVLVVVALTVAFWPAGPAARGRDVVRS